MQASLRSLLVLVALLISSMASAQDQPLKGWLGVELQDVTKEEADKLGWDAPRGAKVATSKSNSPADQSGLRAGDIIVAIDRAEIDTASELAAALETKRPGTQVRLTVLSGGRERRLTATLAEQPKSEAANAQGTLQLMLDTGGHMAKIAGVAITPDGKHIVSASNDKTVRVWDIASGKTTRIIRGEAASGNWGVIQAMALSPDGRLLALGGQFHASDRTMGSVVRVFDFASGRQEALLKGHGDVVRALAFSPDGKHLLSGSDDKTAIVWDLASRQQTQRLTGHAGDVQAVAFSKDGSRIVTGSADGALKLWRVNGSVVADMAEHKTLAQQDSKKPELAQVSVEALSVSPDDQLIVSSSSDGRILLWNANTGAFLRQLANPGGMVGFSRIRSVSFSPDGQWLLSASEFEGCAVYQISTGGELVNGKLHEKPPTMFDKVRRIRCNGGLAYSPDGRIVAAGYNSTVHVFEPGSTTPAKILQSAGAPVFGVGFAQDGRSIAWGNTLDEGEDKKPKLTHRLRLPLNGTPLGVIDKLDGSSASPSDAYVRRNAQHGALSVAFKSVDRMLINTRFLDISKDGTHLAQIDLAERGSSGRSPITFTPDGETVLVGLAPRIDAFDVSGAATGSFIGHEATVRDLVPSPDGRWLVSGGHDQTVRLWNLKTRELVVSVYRGLDGEWVMWTPQGYYAGSPGADKIVGWQINKGPEQAADYVGAEQLRQHLNRPDIVERAIVLGSAAQAVREAPGTSFTLADLLSRPVPRFRILAPAADSPVQGGQATVRLAVDTTPDPVKAIRVQVNGRQIEELTPSVGSGGFAAGERNLDVPLTQGRNELRITLTNAVGEKAETLTLVHDGEGALDKRGTLYILAVGVDKYPGLGNTCGEKGNASCDLNFSSADARRFVAASERRLGPAHTQVVKRVLVNGGGEKDDPTASNILDALDLLKQAREADTVLLFIAGHATNDGPNYRFLATNAEWSGGALRGSTVVPWHALQEAVETAKGRRILFVDTCHGGNAYNQRLGNAAYHANIIAYTAARFDQEALEDAGLGHGLFTFAMVEALEGQAVEFKPNAKISTRELATYVVRRVDELAKRLNGAQEPQYFKGRDAEDYVLAQ
jgi:WD40 repeat protein